MSQSKPTPEQISALEDQSWTLVSDEQRDRGEGYEADKLWVRKEAIFQQLLYQAGRESMLEELRDGGVEIPVMDLFPKGDDWGKSIRDYGDRRAAAERERVLTEAASNVYNFLLDWLRDEMELVKNDKSLDEDSDRNDDDGYDEHPRTIAENYAKSTAFTFLTRVEKLILEMKGAKP